MNFVEFLKKYRGIEPPLADKYGDWLGYEIEDFDNQAGDLRTRLKIREEHLSPSSAVHGGVISGFLDFSCGCAVFATIGPNELCSTVDLNVKYFKPINLNDCIVAAPKIVHRGRSLSSVVANLYLKDQPERILAMATGTFNIYEVKT